MAEDHAYLSTACQHLKHEQCRQTCKFCESACLCICHAYERRAAAEAATQAALDSAKRTDTAPNTQLTTGTG